MSDPRLFHFTCEHGYRAIGKRGVLRPSAHPWLTEPLVWMTSVEWPDRFATGLTSETLHCDRMSHRYVVTDAATCVPWVESWIRQDQRRDVLRDMESYGDIEHWWVSTAPVPARLA